MSTMGPYEVLLTSIRHTDFSQKNLARFSWLAYCPNYAPVLALLSTPSVTPRPRCDKMALERIKLSFRED